MTLDSLSTVCLLFKKDNSFTTIDPAPESVLQAIEPGAEDAEILQSGVLPGSGRRYFWSRLAEPADPINQVLTAWTGSTIYGNAVVMPQEGTV